MIGIFDSGSGGLTVLSALRNVAPRTDVVYFGDIANAPYGEKSSSELETLTEAGFKKLLQAGASELISACNSVSTSVLMGVAGSARVIEMTRPTARALRAHAGKRMLLLATPATIRSRIYHDALGVTLLLDEVAISGLASAIEKGAAESEIETIIRTALDPHAGKKYDGVILGCTHYPFARTTIVKIAEELLGDMLVFDPAEAVAEEVAARFDIAGSSAMKFILSKDSNVFRERVNELFPDSSYTIEVV